MPRNSHTKPVRRLGAVSVEFALVAPILLMLFWGSIEFSRANMLMHSIAIAATEAAREGIIDGATTAQVEARARTELSYLGVAEADVMVEPAVLDEDSDYVVVAISVPMTAANGYMAQKFFLGKSLQKTVGMTREAKSSKEAKDKLAAAMARAQAKLASSAAKAAEKAAKEATKAAAAATKAASKAVSSTTSAATSTASSATGAVTSTVGSLTSGASNSGS